MKMVGRRNGMGGIEDRKLGEGGRELVRIKREIDR